MSEAEDVFISHAWEDKVAVVEPLVTQLMRRRVSVWYDEHSLQIGDSLRERIDEGLARARFGVVILSPSFFAKQWPKEELDGMFTRRTADGSYKILPVWHDVTKEDVAKFSPMLAGKLAANTSNGLQRVATQIQRAVTTQPLPEDPAAYGMQYRDQTLKVSELPLGVGGMLENASFARCHFVGPGVIFLGDSVHMDSCAWPSHDIFFPIAPGRRYFGFVGIRRAAFFNCTFAETVGLAVPEGDYEEMRLSFDQGEDYQVPPGDGFEPPAAVR